MLKNRQCKVILTLIIILISMISFTLPIFATNKQLFVDLKNEEVLDSPGALDYKNADFYQLSINNFNQLYEYNQHITLSYTTTKNYDVTAFLTVKRGSVYWVYKIDKIRLSKSTEEGLYGRCVNYWITGEEEHIYDYINGNYNVSSEDLHTTSTSYINLLDLDGNLYDFYDQLNDTLGFCLSIRNTNSLTDLDLLKVLSLLGGFNNRDISQNITLDYYSIISSRYDNKLLRLPYSADYKIYFYLNLTNQEQYNTYTVTSSFFPSYVELGDLFNYLALDENGYIEYSVQSKSFGEIYQFNVSNNQFERQNYADTIKLYTYTLVGVPSNNYNINFNLFNDYVYLDVQESDFDYIGYMNKIDDMFMNNKLSIDNFYNELQNLSKISTIINDPQFNTKLTLLFEHYSSRYNLDITDIMSKVSDGVQFNYLISNIFSLPVILFINCLVLIFLTIKVVLYGG